MLALLGLVLPAVSGVWPLSFMHEALDGFSTVCGMPALGQGELRAQCTGGIDLHGGLTLQTVSTSDRRAW